MAASTNQQAKQRLAWRNFLANVFRQQANLLLLYLGKVVLPAGSAAVASRSIQGSFGHRSRSADLGGRKLARLDTVRLDSVLEVVRVVPLSSDGVTFWDIDLGKLLGTLRH